jgi:hypothetical protein
MVEEACEGLAGVAASQVEMQSGIQFYDGITTAEIQEILIRSASDLIDLETPNYQFVAARLLLFGLYKQVCPCLESGVSSYLRSFSSMVLASNIYDKSSFGEVFTRRVGQNQWLD